MRQICRNEIIKALHEKIRQKRLVIAGGAGLGIVAKMQEAAGIDLIMAYNTGPYRMDGTPSFIGHMSYGNCNRVTMELVDILVNQTESVPIIAGVGAEDPFLDLSDHIEQLCYRGVSGITNVPTIGGRHKGSLQGPVALDMEANGFGFAKEVEMIRYCRNRNILTAVYAFETEQVRQMVQAGADIIAPHVGGTAGGLTGFAALSVEAAADKISRMYQAAVSENPDVIVLCHGGPLKDPESVRRCIELTGVQGFIGASALERIPVERELAKVVRGFKKTQLR